MLLSLPLEIWEMIFDLLTGQNLQLLSEVESLARPRIPPTHKFLPLATFRSLDFVIH